MGFYLANKRLAALVLALFLLTGTALSALSEPAPACTVEAGWPDDMADQAPEFFGATGGNLQNGGPWNDADALYGMTAQDGAVVLGRMDEDGSVLKLADGYVSQVNVLSGMVYYVSIPDPRKTSGIICCVPADGSGQPVQLSQNKAVFLLAAGDTLYYTLEKSGYLYTMKSDGTGRELLVKGSCGRLGGDGDFVYFQNKSKKTLNLLNIKSGEMTSLRLDYSGYGQFVDGIFYYRDTKKRLCSINADGSDKAVLFSGSIDSLNAADGFLYFANMKDKGKPYRMNLDGTELVKLADVTADYIVTAGESVYLIDQKKGIIHLMQADGTLTQMQ